MISTFDDEFPGNNATYQNLKDAVLAGDLVFIVGAGVSAPKLPLWTDLIKNLAKEALNEGMKVE